MPLRLYDYVLESDAYKVRLALALMGLTYETIAIDMVPGREHRAADHLIRDPLGRVPLLDDDGVIVREPAAILVHLATVHAPTGGWWPEEPADRVAALDWLAFSATRLGVLAEARRHALFHADLGAVAAPDAARRAIEAFEDHMAGRWIDGFAWVVGSERSVVDIALFADVALAHDAGMSLDVYPALRRWVRAVRSLPGFVGMPGIPEIG